MDYKFAYLIGSLIFGFVWFFIFIRRKDLRKQQLTISLIVSTAGLSEHLFFKEYWSPQFIFQLPGINAGIESIILCFFYGGISSSLYEILFHKKHRKDLRTTKSKRHIETILSFFVGTLVTIILWKLININIIYSSTVGMLAMGIILNFYRRDLFMQSLLNGLSMSILSLTILVLFGLLFKGIFESWWNISSLSGVQIFHVPLEEVLWHFGLGFALGPLYEVFLGYIDCKIPSHRKFHSNKPQYRLKS